MHTHIHSGTTCCCIMLCVCKHVNLVFYRMLWITAEQTFASWNWPYVCDWCGGCWEKCGVAVSCQLILSQDGANTRLSNQVQTHKNKQGKQHRITANSRTWLCCESSGPACSSHGSILPEPLRSRIRKVSKAISRISLVSGSLTDRPCFTSHFCSTVSVTPSLSAPTSMPGETALSTDV